MWEVPPAEAVVPAGMEGKMMNAQLDLPGAAFEKPLTERQKATDAKAKAQVRRAALNAAKKLDAAAEAMSDYMFACLEAGMPFRGADDARRLLERQLRDFAGFLENKYAKEPS